MEKEISDRVLFVGPDIDEAGGMASVLRNYRAILPSFHYLRTNSRRGSVRGALVLCVSMLRMPVERMRGRRILHVHGCSGKSFVRKSLVMRWGRMLGFRVIFHCHGGGIRDYFASIGLEKARRRLRLADAVVALSDQWLQYFTAELGRTDAVAIPNPIVPVVSDQDTPRVLPLKLIFLGAINKNKGIFDLLEALRRNRARWEGKVLLTVGGDGPLAPQLKEFIADHQLGGMVHYAGVISGADKDCALAGADVAVLPSYVEALPMFILEAMAAAKPVISTPVGGIPEMVATGENGFLVTAGNVDALAEAIGSYLSDRSLVQKHGKNGQSKINPFLPGAIVGKLEALYLGLLKS